MTLATLVSATVAVFALAWQIRISIKDEQHRRSEFALREAILAYGQAYELLLDGNNSREKWIAAARAIETAQRIRSGVTNITHQDVLEIQEDQYRRSFGSCLGWDDSSVGGSFFYGAPREKQDIDEAARASTAHRDNRPNVAALPESVLFSIWTFSQYPQDYEDPLQEGRFSDEQVESGVMRVLWPGLTEYLRHLRRYRSVNGRLKEIEVTANEAHVEAFRKR